jgi:hypothetical protein
VLPAVLLSAPSQKSFETAFLATTGAFYEAESASLPVYLRSGAQLSFIRTRSRCFDSALLARCAMLFVRLCVFVAA